MEKCCKIRAGSITHKSLVSGESQSVNQKDSLNKSKDVTLISFQSRPQIYYCTTTKERIGQQETNAIQRQNWEQGKGPVTAVEVRIMHNFGRHIRESVQSVLNKKGDRQSCRDNACQLVFGSVVAAATKTHIQEGARRNRHHRRIERK